MMDINYELYKVFYHVASTLNFFRGFKTIIHFTISRQSIYKNTGEEIRSDIIYS